MPPNTMEEEDVVTPETLEGEEENEELTKAQELARNQKIRAEKAEKEAKEARARLAELENQKETPQKADDDLTQKDLLSIVRANVHDDDIDRVAKFAKLEGISIAEALKHDDLKAILRSRDEARASAEAANTGNVRRAVPKIDPQVIVAKANKGEIPEAGSKEAEELFWARRGGRRQ